MADMKVIAHLYGGFSDKFGIPRQSGLVNTVSEIIFEREYAVPEAVRGLEGFSHIWLIWEFSKSVRSGWSPTVRPPRLGGNKRMGVFATRSPFRPNAIGLSCVKLIKVEPNTPRGPVLTITGADLLDGTPIYDIKPYLPFTDSIPDATGGFAEKAREHMLKVVIPDALSAELTPENRAALENLLANDPRPAYIDDPNRVFGFEFMGREIRFTVENDILTVHETV